MTRSKVVAAIAVAVVFVGGCGSAADNQQPSATSDQPSTPSVPGETTTVVGGGPLEECGSGGARAPRRDRTTTAGLITEVVRTSTGKWITVEADPEADCRSVRSIRRNPGCDKMYYEVLGKPALVTRDEGCDGEDTREASAEDLEVGQKVRAWTGEPYAGSYPGQARAWGVAICEDRF